MSSEDIKDILNDPKASYALAKDSFSSIDTDGSGYIEAEEFFYIFNSMCQDSKIATPTKDELEEEFKKLDTDGNKKLNIEEFEVFIRTILTALAEA